MRKASSSTSHFGSATRPLVVAIVRHGYCVCGEKILFLTSQIDANPGRKF